MRAQGLSPSVGSDAAPVGLLPDEGAVAVPAVPFRRAAPGARVFAVLYPVCLALTDGWAMAVAVALVRPGGVLPAAAAVAVVALNASGGLYLTRRSPSLLCDAPPLLVRVLAVAAFAAVPLGSAAACPWIAGVAGTIALAVRAFAFASVKTYRCRRSRARAALVVGTGRTAAQLADLLRDRGELGLSVIGQVAADGADTPPVAPVLGEIADLPGLVVRHGADTLVVVAEDLRADHLRAVLRMSFVLPCETLLVQPPSDAVPVPAARREYLAGLPCARIGWRLREPAARSAKRLLDVVAGAALLVLALPVLAACALAVRVEGGPGVLFRQRRIGLGGEEFVLLKFRTLQPVDEHESDTRWTVEGERTGRVGRFLRNTSLDELPQLWNVVRGDMSLVGPRPERPHFVEQFARTCPGYMLRHRVPAGMTGWAQIHGFRGDTSIELRARLDNHYIDHWTFCGDLKILLLTARAMIFRDPG